MVFLGENDCVAMQILHHGGQISRLFRREKKTLNHLYTLGRIRADRLG